MAQLEGGIIEDVAGNNAAKFSVIGSAVRLQIMRLLLASHPHGLIADQIEKELEIPHAALIHDLDKLRRHELIRVSQEGTSVYYTGNTDTLDDLLRFGCPSHVVWSGDRCQVCGEPFQRRKRWQKHCSHRCRQKAYVRRNDGGNETAHCLPNVMLRMLGMNDSDIHDCQVCGKPFRAQRSTQKHCSHACRQSAYRSRLAARGVASAPA